MCSSDLTEPAQQILNKIPLQDRDSRWQGLQTQIELLIKAADTPEIQQLQEEFAKQPSHDLVSSWTVPRPASSEVIDSIKRLALAGLRRR